MKHIKKHPINDKAQTLSKDMKKQDLVKPKTDKKLDADDSLSDPKVSKKYVKPSNKKLDGENFLAIDSKVKNLKENQEWKDKDLIIVDYYLLNENMDDEEMDDAPERNFIITEDMIIKLIEEHTEWNREGGDYVDTENIYVKKI